MENLVKELLKIKFPTVHLEALMEIVNATQNPVIATEILCNVYQEPRIKARVKLSREIYYFDSFNKWSQEVKYHYFQEETRSGYFDESLDLSTVTLENFDELKKPWDTNVKSHSIPTGRILRKENSMSLEKWSKYDEHPKPCNLEEWYEKQEAQKASF